MDALTITYSMRLLTALLIGGLVGLEREFHGKPAGLRTNILMCVGSCLVMIISLEVARNSPSVSDPGRIAAQVVTGVGFLCAGTIMRSRFTVSGLTTAATIWVLSALGLAIGAGYLMVALVGAFLITLTLIGIRYVEAALGRHHSTHLIKVAMDPREGIVARVMESVSSLGISSDIHEVDLSGEEWAMTFEYDAPGKKHASLIRKISEIDGISSVTKVI
ncbi:MAG TPA: MgtC/SapB family protein [Candidatus Krumholzibacterium sp.]|nr:MgtC/SapB family protein [Candidatus Krumholzibacterium sp.]